MQDVNTNLAFPEVKLVDATKGLFGFFTTEEKREHKRYWNGIEPLHFGDKLNLKLSGLDMFPEGLQFVHSAMLGVAGETRSADTVRKELSWTMPFATAFDCSTIKGVSNAMLWTLLAAITYQVRQGALKVNSSAAQKLPFYVSTVVTTETGEVLELTVLSEQEDFIDFVDNVRTFACNGIVKLTPAALKQGSNAEVETAASLAVAKLFGTPIDNKDDCPF